MIEQPQPVNPPSRWALVALVLALFGGLALIVWGIDHYWGGDGVRVAGVGLAIVALVLFVVGLGRWVQGDAMRMAMDHHDNILRGLIGFQNADDRGEVARTVATGISGALRSGNQLDRTVLTLAGRMAQGQLAAQHDAQRQLVDSQVNGGGGPTWAMHPGAEVEADFKIVE